MSVSFSKAFWRVAHRIAECFFRSIRCFWEILEQQLSKCGCGTPEALRGLGAQNYFIITPRRYWSFSFSFSPESTAVSQKLRDLTLLQKSKCRGKCEDLYICLLLIDIKDSFKNVKQCYLPYCFGGGWKIQALSLQKKLKCFFLLLRCFFLLISV